MCHMRSCWGHMRSWVGWQPLHSERLSPRLAPPSPAKVPFPFMLGRALGHLRVHLESGIWNLGDVHLKAQTGVSARPGGKSSAPGRVRLDSSFHWVSSQINCRSRAEQRGCSWCAIDAPLGFFSDACRPHPSPPPATPPTAPRHGPRQAVDITQAQASLPADRTRILEGIEAGIGQQEMSRMVREALVSVAGEQVRGLGFRV